MTHGTIHCRRLSHHGVHFALHGRGYSHRNESGDGWKGDVIEFVLSVARDTGPAISKEVTLSRIKFYTAMAAFARSFEDFCHVIYVNEDGPPRMHYFLPPDVLVKAYLFAYYRMKDDQGPRNYYKEQYGLLKAGIEGFCDWTYHKFSGTLIPGSCRFALEPLGHYDPRPSDEL